MRDNLAIYDRIITKEILRISCFILRNYFYYDDESLCHFIDDFTVHIARELNYFEQIAEERVIDELIQDRIARMYFTCYFVSAHLREIFIHKLHFTEQEIYAFENILPKYTGEKSYDKPKCERAHD